MTKPYRNLLSAYQFQELLIVHLLIRNIFSVVKQRIIRDGCRCLLRFLSAVYVDRAKHNIIFRSSLFEDRDVLRVERALACVVQYISLFIYMRMLCAFPKLWPVCIRLKRKIPQLDSVIRLVTDRKALIFQKFRVRKKRLLLSCGQNAETQLSLCYAVLNAGI